VSTLSTAPAETGRYLKIEQWLASNAGLIVAVSLLAAFALRLTTALGTFLNPDEALHYLLVNQTSPGDAYRASLTNAHPPLYFVLLYYWRFAGSSEIILRLPSVLAGTAACWMAFRWIAMVLGRTAGVAALLLMALSPTLIALGAQVRAYSVFLFWMAAALYFLERAFRDQRVSSVVYFSLFLYLAILTHYSALWFVLACGLYVLIRIRALTGRARIAWALFQTGAAAIYAWLYVVHISKLRGSPMEAEAITGWLKRLYFRPGVVTPASFLGTSSVDLFQFLFASTAGTYVLWLFIAGVLWMVTAGILKKRFDLVSFGVFLLLPFALAFTAAMVGVYPYGGTRHLVFLVLFAVAGVGFLVANAFNQKLIPVLILMAVITPYWHRHRLPDPQDMDREAQKKAWMTEALAYLHAAVPRNQPLFTDYQASIMLAYYLGRDQPPQPMVECSGIRETKYGSYRVVIVPGWSATAAEMLTGLHRWRSACSTETPENSFWIFDSGWGLNLLDDMKVAAPQSVSEARHYGVTTSVFKFQLNQ
jgi:hypothetical protein